jgi:hypothetical protein
VLNKKKKMKSKAMEVTMQMVRPVFQQHSLSKDFFSFFDKSFSKDYNRYRNFRKTIPQPNSSRMHKDWT